MTEPNTAANRAYQSFLERYLDLLAEADEHPEATCQRCGGPNLQTWHAPSPLWNAVMRQDDGPEPFSGIVCPRCFGELAREAGVADHFCVTTHHAKVALSTVFGDGRVWDAARCMWVEAPLEEPVDTGPFGQRFLARQEPER